MTYFSFTSHKIKRIAIGLFSSCLYVILMKANAQEKTPLHAHVHGQAQLQLAIDQTQATMSFSSPLDNFLGFERAPKDEIEQVKVNQLLQQLNNPLTWFELSNTAQCQLKHLEIDSPTLTGKPKNSADKKHGDLRFELDLQCKNPQQLRSVKALVLQHYKGIKRLKVEVVHGSSQFAKILQIDDANFVW